MANKIKIGLSTHVGVARKGKPNQDAIKVLQPPRFSKKPHLLILADGMGGQKGGEIASGVVVKAIAEVYEGSKSEDYIDVLEQGIKRAHFHIQAEAGLNNELDKMGSTVVVGALAKNNLWLVSVGDSRAYLIRNDKVIQLSYDHTWVNQMVSAGKLTEQEAKTHPKRNVLTMSINAAREMVETFKGEFEIMSGDVLVLSSDGLWGTISKSQIKAVVTEMPPEEAAEKLISMANFSGSQDNISVIIAAID